MDDEKKREEGKARGLPSEQIELGIAVANCVKEYGPMKTIKLLRLCVKGIMDAHPMKQNPFSNS